MELDPKELETNLAKAFDIKNVMNRLNEQMAPSATAPQPVKQEPQWIPVDIYQHNQRKLLEDKKKDFPKGSRTIVKALANELVGGRAGLAMAKKRAEYDSEALKASGYKDRADLAKQQYMEEKFIPAVETIIEYTSPDEFLNCKEALSAFDNMAIGVGSMSGYTAAYIREAYGNQLGQKRGGSDSAVVEGMRRIRSLVSDDEIRTAIGLAQRLKKQIDNGEHQASPEDYAVIGRVVAYAN